MVKIIELIKKNFKLLVRAKVSSLVIFIGPLLLVSLLGLAYSQSTTFTLTASVHSESYSDLSESLIEKMTNQNFRVLRQDSTDDCISSVKRLESQACIIFPKDMTTTNGQTNEVTFYVDYSQMNLVWLIIDVMSARVSEKSEEISKELTDDLLNRMWFVEERLRTGQSLTSSIKSEGAAAKESGEEARTGVQRLDLSVDFTGIDINSSQTTGQNISAILTGISDQVSNISQDIDSAINKIEGSAADIEAETNNSVIMDEIDDIDNAADDIQDAVDSLILYVDSDVETASIKIDAIIESFEAINQKLSETRSKISSVKKKRDELLPHFETISANIDSMTSKIDTLQGSLDQALQKISAIKGTSAESIVTPITTRIEPVATQKTHFNSLFPTLLVLVIMITGILLSATLVIVDKKSRAFLRNNFTPTSYFTFSLSTYLTSLIVLFVQLLLFVSVSAFFFETSVLASIWVILFLVLLACTVFICIGMFIGFIFKTEETVTLASITIATVLLLFSSAVVPLESLPAYLKQIAMFNPFVVSEFAFRQAIIFQLGFAKIMSSLGLLASYAVGIFAILIATQNALRRLSFVHFTKLHFGSGIVNKKNAQAGLSKPETQDNK
ncbi:ABC transporter permease, partial [Candidatus Woesearchaeota archaeon]|nr:ABC transporter permease [Candidatus Woesearchaeota archaeon]